jgi:guanylate kinase
MADLTDQLGGKHLVMVVGPAAVGKSSVMHTAVERDSRFGYARSFTTRPNRSDGRSTYRHITDDEARKIESSDDVVTYVKHPTTGYVYGTDTKSYSAEYNLLDTLSGTVETYRKLPFLSTTAISLTTDPNEWKRWFVERYPEPSAERSQRLREAILSIEWSLAQGSDHQWLVNRTGNVTHTSSELIDMVTDSTELRPVPNEAVAMLAAARDLLSYE